MITRTSSAKKCYLRDAYPYLQITPAAHPAKTIPNDIGSHRRSR